LLTFALPKLVRCTKASEVDGSRTIDWVEINASGQTPNYASLSLCFVLIGSKLEWGRFRYFDGTYQNIFRRTALSSSVYVKSVGSVGHSWFSFC